MKTWIELAEDVCCYYQWFEKNKFADGSSTFGVLSFNGSLLFGQDERTNFIKKSGQYFQKIFEADALSPYTLYIQANIQVNGMNSRVDKFMKVWRKLQKTWTLDAFIKGPEVEIVLDDSTYFSSIAKFEVQNLPEALRLITYFPHRFIIFASQRKLILTEESVREMFYNSFSKKLQEVDYQNLVLRYQDDIIFRWGDSAEEAEIAIITNSHLLKEIKK